MPTSILQIHFVSSDFYLFHHWNCVYHYVSSSALMFMFVRHHCNFDKGHLMGLLLCTFCIDDYHGFNKQWDITVYTKINSLYVVKYKGLYIGGGDARSRSGHDTVWCCGCYGYGSGRSDVQPGQLAAGLGAARRALAALGSTDQPTPRRRWRWRRWNCWRGQLAIGRALHCRHRRAHETILRHPT